MIPPSTQGRFEPTSSKRRRLVLAAVSYAILACAACGGASDAPADGTAAAGGLIRLTDLLDEAVIRTPLTGIRAASRLDELGEIPLETVFVEDFENLRASKRWPTSPDARVVETDDGHAFQLRGRTWQERRAWRIAVDPNTNYVLERRVRTSEQLVADFEAVEVPRMMTIDALIEQMGDLGNQSEPHWFPDPVPDGTWQRQSISFSTRSSTKALLIVLWKTPRRSGALADTDGVAYEAWFDDVRLSKLDPTPDQAIALFKAQDHAHDADPDLGMRKRGQFPPMRDSNSGLEGLEDNYSFRNALYVPPPTELAFPLLLGSDPFLRFSFALSRHTRPGDSAAFKVLVRADGREESLWSRTLHAVPEDWRWFEGRVDLVEYSGRPVTLVLETSAVEGDPHPMWGNPVVGQPVDERDAMTVILIAVDTLRADRLSSYGYSKPTSPHLDALAADGVRFDQVVSNATWTCPSFASIFTGVMPSRHRVWVAGSFWARLPGRFETLAERFRDHGWVTQSIAYKAPLYASGYDQGFDVSFVVPREVTDADENLAKALDWLESNAGLPNFLFLHFNDPHQPFNQPKPFRDAFGPVPDALSIPYYVEKLPFADRDRDLTSDLYDGEVAYVDDRIGALLDELKSRGLYDNAVIVFVSDHGEALWEHETFGHSLGKLYDEGIRVPLIVKPAGESVARNRIVKTQVRAFDVMPTLLELAGIPVTGELDAASLVPLLEDGAGETPDRLAITETYNGGLSLRTRRWKYISQNWRRSEATELLFDLSADPGERHDVASRNPDVVRDMRTQVLEHVMLNRPGRYLVAIRDDPGKQFSFHVGGIELIASVHGPGGDLDGDGTIRFTGESEDHLAVVARIKAVGSMTILDTKQAPRPFTRYAAGDLERLMQRPEPGVHLFDGPSAGEEEALPAEPMDPTQLDALRALGYLGGGNPDPEGH